MAPAAVLQVRCDPVTLRREQRLERAGVGRGRAALRVAARVAAAQADADHAAGRRERRHLVDQPRQAPSAGRGEVDARARPRGRARRRRGGRGAERRPAGRRAHPPRRRRPPAASGRSHRARPGRGRARRPAPPAPRRSAGSSPAATRRSSWHQPSRTANGMPPRKPLGVVSGVFRSPWASIHTSARSGCVRRRPAVTAGASVHSPRSASGSAAPPTASASAGRPAPSACIGRGVEVESDPPPAVAAQRRRDRIRPLLHPRPVEPARPRRQDELAAHRSASGAGAPGTSARSSS